MTTPRALRSSSVLRCPHCRALDFHRTDPDTERECHSCGYNGICSVCGDQYDGDDGHAQQCSDRCWQVAGEEDRAEQELQARMDREAEYDL